MCSLVTGIRSYAREAESLKATADDWLDYHLHNDINGTADPCNNFFRYVCPRVLVFFLPPRYSLLYQLNMVDGVPKRLSILEELDDLYQI